MSFSRRRPFDHERLLDLPSNGYPAEFSWCNKAEPKWAQKHGWFQFYTQWKSTTPTMVSVGCLRGGNSERTRVPTKTIKSGWLFTVPCVMNTFTLFYNINIHTEIDIHGNSPTMVGSIIFQVKKITKFHWFRDPTLASCRRDLGIAGRQELLHHLGESAHPTAP